jgi:hypothetical protein
MNEKNFALELQGIETEEELSKRFPHKFVFFLASGLSFFEFKRRTLGRAEKNKQKPPTVKRRQNHFVSSLH